MKQNRLPAIIALAQGMYYLSTGIWPIVSRRSFEKITGPKVDFWLVKTVGGLIGVIGATLALAGLRGRPEREIALLGAGSAASLGASDVIYASGGRISRIYLLESIVEAGLVGLWVWSAGRGFTSRRASVLQFSPDNDLVDRL